jgi:hypothetical protein
MSYGRVDQSTSWVRQAEKTEKERRSYLASDDLNEYKNAEIEALCAYQGTAQTKRTSTNPELSAFIWS